MKSKLFCGLGAALMLLIVPVWGPALLMFALHRFCVALRMTLEAGLRAEKVQGRRIGRVRISRLAGPADEAERT